MNRPLLDKAQFPESPPEPVLAPLELPTSLLVERLREANKNHPGLAQLRQDAIADGEIWKLSQGTLTFKNRLVIPEDNNLRLELIREAHDKPAIGHPGERRTLELIRDRYYWKGIKSDICQYVRNCHSCKRAKPSND